MRSSVTEVAWSVWMHVSLSVGRVAWSSDLFVRSEGKLSVRRTYSCKPVVDILNIIRKGQQRWGGAFAASIVADHCPGTFFETRAVASWPALGPWAPPAERRPSLESIYRVSLTVDLCEGNEIISLKKICFTTTSWGPLKKEKKSGGPGHVPSVPIG